MNDLYKNNEPSIDTNVVDFSDQLKIRDDITFYSGRTKEFLTWLERKSAIEIVIKGENAFSIEEGYLLVKEDITLSVDGSNIGVNYINISFLEPSGASLILTKQFNTTTTIASFIVDENGSILSDSLRYLYGTIHKAMPIGYVYLQYAGTKSPEELWPYLQWQDISNSYNGRYFRPESGDSVAFEGGLGRESLPNITGRFRAADARSALDPFAEGAFYEDSFLNNYISGGGETGYRYVLYGLDASLSSPIYQERANVNPFHETVRIWRRIGTLAGTQTFYEYDANGFLVQERELSQDEAGFIGYNPNSMTVIAPTSTSATFVKPVWSRALGSWQEGFVPPPPVEEAKAQPNEKTTTAGV